MNTKDILSVLNFSAFRPEEDDPSSSWRRRFPRHRTALVTVGRNMLAWKGVQRNGQAGEGEVLRGDPKELLSQVSLHIKDATEEGWCAMALNSRYVISLETNLSRRPGSEGVLKTNPRSVLGARYERGKRYAVTHSPETNSSILVACDEDQIRKAETQFREAGLKLGRIACGAYVLLCHALSETNTTKGGDTPASFFYVVCSQGSVCALLQDEDRWMELRSRTDVYDDSVEPVLELLAPFAQKVPPAAEVVLVCDSTLPDIVEGLGRLFPGNPLRDLTKPNLLSTLMVQN